MLLNEFLKEHRKVQTLEATVAQQSQESQAQRAEIKNLIATLKPAKSSGPFHSAKRIERCKRAGCRRSVHPGKQADGHDSSVE
jgi:hypothetical protein